MSLEESVLSLAWRLGLPKAAAKPYPSDPPAFAWTGLDGERHAWPGGAREGLPAAAGGGALVEGGLTLAPDRGR